MRASYACHELENRCLGLIKQDCYLVQAGHHLAVFSNGTGHAACERIPQIVIDVEFARRSWSEESVVQAYVMLALVSINPCTIVLTVGRSQCLPD